MAKTLPAAKTLEIPKLSDEASEKAVQATAKFEAFAALRRPTEEKTPLQSVTTVLCDALCELPVEDRQRALDIVILTLGIDRPSTKRFATQRAIIQMFGDLFTSMRTDQLAVISPVLDETQMQLLGNLVRTMALLEQQAAPDDHS